LSYWAAVVTRNGSEHVRDTIDSLLNQDVAPKRIAVVDDGSTDSTPTVLRNYAQLDDRVSIITKPDRGYDIRRVPANINQAWAQNSDLTTDYFMISGDDCRYPPNYAIHLLARMEHDSKLAITSGRPTSGGIHSQEHSPSGSGRMVRSSFWRAVGAAYPVKAGWETWLLYKAEQEGLESRLIEDLEYVHARPRGAAHQFVYWGAAMETLGYHPLYAVGRIGLNALKPSVSPKRAANMLRGYMQAKLGSDDLFMTHYDDSLRYFVWRKQSQRIVREMKTALRIVA